MNNGKQLGAAAVAVTMLFGASAFAEQRPSNGTRREGGRIERRERSTQAQGRVEVRGERNTSRSRESERSTTRSRDNDVRTERSTTRSRDNDARIERRERATTRSRDTEPQRSVTNESRSRGRNDRDRNDRGSYNRRDNNDWRGSSNNRGSYDRNRGGNDRYRGNDHRYNRSRPYYHSGRVSRYERWGGGYRVWVGGAPYPFYVPLAHWSAGRFGIGLSIRLGGYYNSLGYYDYYDGYSDGYRAGNYSSGRVYNTVELSGTVEDYNYRTRTALIRDDATDNLVTVYMRSRDARLNHLRVGDYIELEGGWKGGLFEAYRVFDID